MIDASTGQQLAPQLDEDGSFFFPLKENLNPSFVKSFDDGVAAYLAGNWSEAKNCLDKAAALKDGGDNPTKMLMKVMKSKNFKAPDSWRGFRELTSKT